MTQDNELVGDRDILVLLRDDHARIRALVTDQVWVAPDARLAASDRAADLLIRHEVAEELVVYPALLAVGVSSAVVDSRLREQEGIERRLVDLDRADFDSPEFASVSARLGLDVMAHFDREEQQVLPLLAARIGRRRRVELADQFVAIKELAPARRVVPGARTPTGRTIVDRTTAVATWMRDSAAAAGIAC